MDNWFQRLTDALTGRASRGSGGRRPGGRPSCPPSRPPLDFDALAREVAGGLSRREALRRLGSGLATAALASLGLGTAAAAAGNSDCAQFCHSIYPPGSEQGQCTSDAARQAGLCYGCGPAAPAGHPDLCGAYGGPRYCCTGALPNCCGGTTCVNQQTDANNCGACGNVCPAWPNATATCSGGQCGYTCLAGFADCNTSAADGCETSLLTDVGNCGGCGIVCATPANATPTCSGGKCGYTCQDGFADCDGDPTNGCEIDLTRNSQNCGSCGHACPPGEVCHNGGCFPIAPGTTGMGCSPGETLCGSLCVNTSTDASNCGACGHACTAGFNCSGGICCPPFAANCGGTCINIEFDPANCGACGRACPQGASCCNGQCVSTEFDPLNCGGCGIFCRGSAICCGGRCVDTTLDSANCGACGHVCAPGQQCCSGHCTDTSSDVAHCGNCFNFCWPRADNCAAGRCQCGAGPACSAGQNCLSGICCPSDATNCGGACVFTSVDNQNCGACGHTCPSGQMCSNGKCCSNGQTNCGGTCTILAFDARNCGACGTICPASGPNTVAACINYQCHVTCQSGFADCDGNSANGCETNINTDLHNCGSCGHACTPGLADNCTGGTCRCGSGAACSIGQVCSSGICCVIGQVNCGGICKDLSRDSKNCGSCGHVCSGFFSTCVNGNCI